MSSPSSRYSSAPQASTNYKEAFALFDKRGTGHVELSSLGDLLRACGQNPTLAEIYELEQGVRSDCESGAVVIEAKADNVNVGMLT